jgi:hypothetical protein
MVDILLRRCGGFLYSWLWATGWHHPEQILELSPFLILHDWLTVYWGDLGVFAAPDFAWLVDIILNKFWSCLLFWFCVTGWHFTEEIWGFSLLLILRDWFIFYWGDLGVFSACDCGWMVDIILNRFWSCLLFWFCVTGWHLTEDVWGFLCSWFWVTGWQWNWRDLVFICTSDFGWLMTLYCTHFGVVCDAVFQWLTFWWKDL